VECQPAVRICGRYAPEVDGAVVAVGPVEIADDARALAVLDRQRVGVDETRQRDADRHQPDDEDHREHDAAENARSQRVYDHRVPAANPANNQSLLNILSGLITSNYSTDALVPPMSTTDVWRGIT